ncbi:hypothetical protein [Algisphaera agarilytica]|uniref:Ribosomal protein S27E n=1 Tax=Algisphaera agarilytica TaxID=1385975 RepID=A0A7X0H765_9BACT|nr:hypothetical protein [Algisphaera agarilytica]MBB6430523.1 ribosomal protein S27E [Algisphaera agarilytica]
MLWILSYSVTVIGPEYAFPDWLERFAESLTYQESIVGWLWFILFSLLYSASLWGLRRFGLPQWACVTGCGCLFIAWIYNILAEIWIRSENDDLKILNFLFESTTDGWSIAHHRNHDSIWLIVLLWLWGSCLWCLVCKQRWNRTIWVPWGLMVLYIVAMTAHRSVGKIGDLVILESGYDLYYLAAASQMIAWCFTLAFVLIVLRGGRMSRAGSTLAGIQVRCPRCEAEQLITSPEARCKKCRMILRVAAIEPRCPHCDYILHSPTTPECPECGERLPDVEIVQPQES